jgi:hypothetical protein
MASLNDFSCLDPVLQFAFGELVFFSQGFSFSKRKGRCHPHFLYIMAFCKW